MARNNRNSRNASNRPRGGWRSQSGSQFYIALAAAAALGVAALIYATQKKPDEHPENSTEFAAAEAERIKNAGPAQPYVLGDTNAPVKIEEFADYECPSCARFSVITGPDVRTRIVQAGLASYWYYDFPLAVHHNTQAASNAAACADEQQKFWEMHDKLYNGQDQWGLDAFGQQVTDNPKDIFKRFAGEVGLSVAQWEQCFDAKKYQKRIDGNYAEGVRRKVSSTPTILVNGKVIFDHSYDAIKAAVDSARAATGAGTQ